MKSSLQLNLNVNVSVVEGFNLEFILSFTQRFVPPLFSRLVVSRNEKEADRHALSREGIKKIASIPRAWLWEERETKLLEDCINFNKPAT
ncbi:hypothetical protein RHGRI_009814 [Rhododendron griersonianum]|uniref:Uncharacterized protein n=1 Tax=Rhododendron griersonianum TaxID=479676 RepID=A0AAV6KG76_9ERIC|nr:hypothetical protein RHGRI_009814 [Rhododendron griersonianum]